ncbi:sure-like protein [Pisolithus microcarpus]|nr:sure-like protein [Pisolithus microcarpus]
MTPKVLLVNDDGPPGPDSPYTYGLYKHLINDLGWEVKVVIPSSQKSWIGKSYHITEITRGNYFYPREPDGLQGDTSPVSRERTNGTDEWILLDGTPASCTNISLHNLYPGEIDLVISGPNFGRNTSAAFSLSSGTIGGAMCGALSRTRAIAISYGTVHRVTPTEWIEPAHLLAVRIIKHLWENWGRDTRNGKVDLYTVNIPMIPQLATPDGLDTYWAFMWRNSYGQLFKALDENQVTMGVLSFEWSPDIEPLVSPDISTLPVGSDGWAFSMGYATVTPLMACFAEAESCEETDCARKPRLLRL